MDKLQRCAKAFEQLLDKKYRIVIGRKGKSMELELGFEATDFHHLIGLHKLSDLRISRNNREKVFSSILSGNIPIAQIERSKQFLRYSPPDQNANLHTFVWKDSQYPSAHQQGQHSHAFGTDGTWRNVLFLSVLCHSSGYRAEPYSVPCRYFLAFLPFR